MYSVIITAAGSGVRSGLGYNKVFYQIGGQACLTHAVSAFIHDTDVSQVIITIQPAEQTLFQQWLEQTSFPLAVQQKVQFVYGGNTRQEGVFRALKEVKSAKVLIHDGARPFVSAQDIQAVKQALRFEPAVIVGVPATDTLKEVDAFKEINRTIDRTKVYYAHTPQGFETERIIAAHELAHLEAYEATDDAQVMEYQGKYPVQIVAGSKYNMKITTPEDVQMAELIYKYIQGEQKERSK